MFLIVDLQRGLIDGWFTQQEAAESEAANWRKIGHRVVVVKLANAVGVRTEIGEGADLTKRFIDDMSVETKKARRRVRSESESDPG